VQEDNNKEALFGRGLIGASRKKSLDPFDTPEDERGPCEVSFKLGATQEKAFLMDGELEKVCMCMCVCVCVCVYVCWYFRYMRFSSLSLCFSSHVLPFKSHTHTHTHTCIQEFAAALHLDASSEALDLSVADATDPLMGGMCHKHPLPLPHTLVKKLKTETDRMFCERFAGEKGGREGTRLGMQPFLREVVGRFKEISTHTDTDTDTQGEGEGEDEKDTHTHTQTQPRPKTLVLYSAHDTVLSPLLGALDVMKEHCYWPPYASRVIFELWSPPNTPTHTHTQNKKGEEEDVVRILYNGAVVSKRSVHCPGYEGVADGGGGGGGGEDETLLPLGCLEAYVEGISSHTHTQKGKKGEKQKTSACE
jgi:hypothetical protein